MHIEDLALQRDKYKHLSDEQWRWFLQQEEGRERTADKLPAFAAIEDWWYPVRISCEQCSSELTARYKAQIVHRPSLLRTFVDLTAGFGVDTYFLSEQSEHTDYVEQNAELCRIAEHNFSLPCRKGKGVGFIAIHNCTAEEFLSCNPSTLTDNRFDLIFLDPARRDSHGEKVFRLEDCTPNVVELLPALLEHLAPEGRILLKLSPMLDLTQALSQLSPVGSPLAWDIHVVAVKNEVKEVLLLSQGKGQSRQAAITCIDLAEPEKAFIFTREEEKESIVHCPTSDVQYIYEPSASILKAGAYKLVAQRYGLQKLDVNTHLYASDELVENFPGRVFKALPEGKGVGSQANIVCRNYPLTPEQLRKKLKLKDGGDIYIIGCRVNGKPTLFTAERI